jgi:hypothetical protein
MAHAAAKTAPAQPAGTYTAAPPGLCGHGRSGVGCIMRLDAGGARAEGPVAPRRTLLMCGGAGRGMNQTRWWPRRRPCRWRCSTCASPPRPPRAAREWTTGQGAGLANPRRRPSSRCHLQPGPRAGHRTFRHESMSPRWPDRVATAPRGPSSSAIGTKGPTHQVPGLIPSGYGNRGRTQKVRKRSPCRRSRAPLVRDRFGWAIGTSREARPGGRRRQGCRAEPRWCAGTDRLGADRACSPEPALLRPGLLPRHRGRSRAGAPSRRRGDTQRRVARSVQPGVRLGLHGDSGQADTLLVMVFGSAVGRRGYEQ